jgi:GTPase SAR1 family protein
VGRYTVTLKLWDGSEGVKELQTKSRRFPKNTDALLLVYAINSQCSADELEGFLIEGLKNSKGAGVFVVGNKADLKKERSVSRQAAQQLSDAMDTPRVCELSATDPSTAHSFMDEIARYLMKRNGIDTPAAKKSGKCTIM